MEIEEAKRRAQAGPLILIARRGFALLITFLSTVTVARLVSPHDYGLANMSGIIISFATLFRDFGLTNAILRKGSISEEELSTIFWFNSATTMLISAVIAAISPLIAHFYGEPVVTFVVIISVLGFIASGLSSQHRAIMNRSLRFGSIAITDTAASLVALIITIVMAFNGLGVWAIVWGAVFQSLISAGAYVRLSHWKPMRYKRDENLGELLRFGGNTSVFSLSVFLSGNLASILIGKFIGTSELGQYNRAQALINLPMSNVVQPITQAIMPLLTHLRKDPDEYRIAYLNLVRNLSTALMPISVILIFAGPSLVFLLIGEQWRQAGVIVSALAPVLAIMGFSYGIADLFITQDRAAELRTLGFCELAIRAAAIGLGLTYGLVGAAVGFSVSTMLVAAIRVVIVGRKGPVKAKDQLRQVLPSLPLALGAATACGLVQLLGSGLTDAIRAIVLVSAGGVAAFAAGILVPTSRHALTELASVFGVRRLLRRVRREA